jgi:uncharacterized repeat protein (TIGR01451 family)
VKPAGQESSSLRPDLTASVPAPPAGSAAVCPPAVTVDRTGPSEARAGEPFTYEIVLRNVGPTPAARVLLEDNLPPGTRVLAAQPPPHVEGTRLLWQVDNLPPGSEARVRVEVQPAAAGPWEGTATVLVSATRTMRVTVGGSAPAPAPVPETPLTLELRGPPQTVVVGHPVGFTVTVGNRGAGTLTGVVLRARLPPELDHEYGRDIELQLDPLRPGEVRRETLQVIPERPGRHPLEVSVKAAGAQPVMAHAEAAAGEDRVLQLRLLGPREGLLFRTYDYRLEVTNRSREEQRDVVLMERLPEGVELVNGTAGGTFDRAKRWVSWRVGTLAPGQTRAVVVRLQPRKANPAVNEVVARTAQGHQARLQTVLRFRAQEARGQATAGVRN